MQPARHHHPRSPTLSAFSLRPDLSLSLYLSPSPLETVISDPLLPPSLLIMSLFTSGCIWSKDGVEKLANLFNTWMLHIRGSGSAVFPGASGYYVTLPRSRWIRALTYGPVRGRVIKIGGGREKSVSREGIHEGWILNRAKVPSFFLFKKKRASSRRIALDSLRGRNISRSFEAVYRCFSDLSNDRILFESVNRN